MTVTIIMTVFGSTRSPNWFMPMEELLLAWELCLAIVTMFSMKISTRNFSSVLELYDLTAGY